MRGEDLDKVPFNVVDRVSVPSVYRLRGTSSSAMQQRRVKRAYHVSEVVDGGVSRVNCTRMLKVD